MRILILLITIFIAVRDQFELSLTEYRLVQSSSTRFEENHKLFDKLLQAGKNGKTFCTKQLTKKCHN